MGDRVANFQISQHEACFDPQGPVAALRRERCEFSDFFDDSREHLRKVGPNKARELSSFGFMSNAETAKEAAALRALELVENDMKLGLGTGSTAKWFVHHLGARVRDGLRVVCTATSLETHAQAEKLGIPLRTLDELGNLDLAVDGTDEITPGLDCIKGHGAALFREKLVEICASRFVVIADDSKLSSHLGIKKTVPVEINPFGRLTTCARLEALGAKVAPRLTKDGTILVTDNGNHIWDCDFGPIDDAAALGNRIKSVVGVCEHGLFCGMVRRAFLAKPDGSVQELLRQGA